MAEETETTPSEPEKFDATLTFHTVDRESQKVRFNGISSGDLDNILATITSAFDSLTKNKSLTLATPDGGIYIFNVDNVTCVEIRR